MHFLEELLSPRTVLFCPKIMAFQLKVDFIKHFKFLFHLCFFFFCQFIKFFFQLLLTESKTSFLSIFNAMGIFNLQILFDLFFQFFQFFLPLCFAEGFKFLDLFLDSFFFLFVERFLSAILYCICLHRKIVPLFISCGWIFFYQSFLDFFECICSLVFLSVPVKQLFHEVTTVLRFLEESLIIEFRAHNSNILQAFAELFFHKIVHQLSIVIRCIEVSKHLILYNCVFLIFQNLLNSLFVFSIIFLPLFLSKLIPYFHLRTFFTRIIYVPFFYIFFSRIKRFKSCLCRLTSVALVFLFCHLIFGFENSIKFSLIVNQAKELFSFDWLALIFLVKRLTLTHN